MAIRLHLEREIPAAWLHGCCVAHLAASVNTASGRYQACPGWPGLLERIDRDGSINAGTFAEGVFRPCDHAAA